MQIKDDRARHPPGYRSRSTGTAAALARRQPFTVGKPGGDMSEDRWTARDHRLTGPQRAAARPVNVISASSGRATRPSEEVTSTP